MPIDDQIWIGQNGEKYGPYSEATVRQWLAEGKLAPEALAWREGMAGWIPLGSLLSASAGHPPAPPLPPAFRPAPAFGQRGSAEADRAALPAPPSLHWGLLLLFTLLTFGIFGIVWTFVQANWIRKMDGQSKATLLLALAIGALVIGEVAYFSGLRSLATGGGALIGFGGLLLLTYDVLHLVAYFAMAGSMRRRLPALGLPVEIGGVTLFFFNLYYLQAQLSWVARWKETGQTTPRASKGVFWILLVLPVFVIAILAAIAIPAYQDYVMRAQVAEGTVLATEAQTAVVAYYDSYHAMPSDNADAGMVAGSSISGKYVSGVDISDGRITVAFETMGANAAIRDKVLVLSPTVSAGRIRWTCNAGSTVPSRELPLSCRH